MIFVLDTDDNGLEVFENEGDAISACEGIDVERSPCEFWDQDGNSLKAVFTKPNERGTFSVVSGTYHLEPKPEGEPLLNLLSKVVYVEGNPPLDSVVAVREYLAKRCR